MKRAVLVLMTFLSATLSGTAHANMGAPTQGGQRTGEPAGIVGVAITREALEIDLRPVASGDLVKVTATYQISNPGEPRRLDLVFASGADRLVDFTVTIDGQPVATRPGTGGELPASWKTPESTPLFDGTTIGFPLRDAQGTASFQLDVATGPHTVVIRYRAQAMIHHDGQPVVLRQFAYVLSPARTWAGFGGLDVTVHVPPRWEVAIAPPLTRTGDTLKGSFSTLPADAIGITTRAPLGAHPVIERVATTLFLVVLLTGGFFVYRAGYRRNRRRAQAGEAPSWMTSASLGAQWALVFIVTGLFAIFGPRLALPTDQIDRRGYGDSLGSVFVVFFAFIVLLLGSGIAAIARRRAFRAVAKAAARDQDGSAG